MSGKPIDEAAVYVECRECRNCEHAGINDACATNAACHSCEWSGPSPTEDKCPGCGDSNCMGAACPKCGSLYRLTAEADVTLTAAQQQGQAVAECHCATCTCAPGMTPAVRFDTSPAAQEGAVRDHLIALGWTPPGAQQPAASAPVGVKTLSEFMAEQEALHPGIHDKVQAATDELRASLAQQPAAVDEAMVERAWVAFCENNGSARQGIRAALTAALAAQPGGSDNDR